jgi:cellulose synthase/poly-beta-1,6-N-acetylglucosamine synthase-like glycosyltransferase
LEIIVASDCSSDRTDEIVRSYGEEIKLIRAPERKGKENAQKYAVEAATGEIFVFSDVATILEPNSISNIVKNFKDPSIGCVSSEDKFININGTISGEGAYVKYEMFLRKFESKVNTLVGLSGSFFAARREVCYKWSIDLQSDFNTLLNSIKLGLRGISDPESIGYYRNITDEKKEYNRKVRTVLRGISVLMQNFSLLNPIKYGLFSWQLFSHKLCRWLVPYFLISLFITNIFIMFSSFFYFFTFFMQAVFYALAYKYHLDNKVLKPNPSSNLFKIPYFFMTVNISILAAWWKYINGERSIFWEPSKRS